MANESEKLTTGPEHHLDITAESAAEQIEKLSQEHEQAGERSIESAERSAQEARIEALETAVSVEASGAERSHVPHEPLALKRRGPISKKERDTSFKNTMKEVQSTMTPASRAFSKFIHAKPVEKTSDVVGTTVARPNAILSGAIFAFICTFAVYLIAKNYGYTLSGFESIGAFIVGWIIGLLFDYFKVLFTGKK